jgi:hypothetical protein
MKNIFSSFIFSLCFQFLSGQSQTFQETFGDSVNQTPYCVKLNSDSGFIITGFTNGPCAGRTDAMMIRTAANGDTLWEKTFGDTGYDGARYGEQTFDGGFIMVGSTTSFGAGGNDVYLVKTNANGIPQWSKSYGGPNHDLGISLVETPDSGFAILCQSASITTYGDLLLIRTNKIGDTLWTKFLNVGLSNPYSIVQTNDDGFMIAGGFNNDAYMLKTDAFGTPMWTKQIPCYISSALAPLIACCRQTADHGYILATATYLLNDSNSIDILLLKTDVSGNPVWSKAIRQTTWGPNSEQWATCIEQTKDKGFIISAIARTAWSLGSYDDYILKTDSVGTISWSKFYGGNGNERFTHRLNSGNPPSVLTDNSSPSWIVPIENNVFKNYAFVSFTQSFPVPYVTDFYFVRTDALGVSGCNEVNEPSVGIPQNLILSNLSPSVIRIPELVANANTIALDPRYPPVVLCSVLSGIHIENNTDINFEIFPNPVSSELNISLDKNEEVNIKIFNTLGQEIDEVKKQGSSFQIDVTGFVQGIYFISITDGNYSATKKFVKE